MQSLIQIQSLVSACIANRQTDREFYIYRLISICPQQLQSFVIIILDVNEPSVNITINSNGSAEAYADGKPIIAENAAVGSVVGSINAFDRDFVTGLNISLDDDASGRFKLSGIQNCVRAQNITNVGTVCSVNLLVSGRLNFENFRTHTITVRAEYRGHFIHQYIIIRVENVNEPAHGLLVNGKASESINENLQGATIGRLAVTDEDSNQTHTFEVFGKYVGIFTTVGEVLKLAAHASLNYEAQQVYTVTLKVTDNGVPQESASLSINVTVANVNEAPTDISLSKTSIAENSLAGTVVANMSVNDPDDTVNNIKTTRRYHVCTLLDSANGRFRIRSGLTLVVGSGELNFEINNNHTITIQCSDGSLTTTKVFAITVTDVNEMPTSVQLSSYRVVENIASRNLIGSLSAIDPDNQAGNRQSFTFGVQGNDSRFEVSGNDLYSVVPFNFETTPFVRVAVFATDDGVPAMTRHDTLRIDVMDANDAPNDLLVSPFNQVLLSSITLLIYSIFHQSQF